MSFRTKRIILITPFYMIFEYFLLKYMFMLICPLSDGILISMALAAGLLHLVPAFFEEKKSRRITRILSEISAIWIWASMMFLIEIVFIYIAGMFIKIDKTLIVMIFLLVPLIGIYAYYKAHKLIVNERILKSDKLSGDINIAHVSDIHFGSVRYKKSLNQLADKLKELSAACSLAIISGDLTDGSCAVNEDDLIALKDVGMPVIFTAGNHDYYIGIENVLKACEKAGIIVLDNESMEIGDLNIYGLSYSFDEIDMPSDDELKANICEDKVNIINYHVPYAWKKHSAMGFDIQLSGHTHGGQFHPATWISEIVFEYNKGLFRDDLGHYLHVTTGFGSMDQPLRWGTDCEVVILKLRKN